jgi:hypothetical protein
MVTFMQLSKDLGYESPIKLALDLKDHHLPLHSQRWQKFYPRTELEPIFAETIRATVESWPVRYR